MATQPADTVALDSWVSRLAELGRSFRFGISYSWRVSRIRTTAIVVVPLAESLLPAALALILRGLVNATLASSQGEAVGSWSIEAYVGLSLALSVALAVAQSLQLYLSQENTEALEHRLAVDLVEQADGLEFGHFERPEFQDTISQVRQTPGHHVHELVAKCIRSLALLIMLTSLLVVLATIEPRLLLYLLPLMAPYLVYRSWVAKQRFLIRVGQNRSQRWIQYYTGQVTSEETLPEARSLDLGPLFSRRITERFSKIRSENHRSFRLELVGSSAFNSLAVFTIHVALLQAANRVAGGSLTVGDIAVFAGAATGLRSSVDSFVMGIGSLRWHLSHLEHLRAFFAMEPAPERVGRATGAAAPREAAAPEIPSGAPLALSDVTFCYPGTQRLILDGVSFKVEQGETVGLVGRNGSGKSTIVKLANGLYPSDRGTVKVAGVNVEQAADDYLRDHVSTVFQHYGRYSASAAESIAMGEWRTLLDQPDEVQRIAERVGLDELIESMPEGYDTLLGRAFGDVAVSGGQWQTFAIARAFARETPLMILDEPTANLDPEAEYEVFERFKELAAGRATLLISHRFSTLALADRIVVLDSGRTEEQGTHDELLALEGTYAHLHRLFRQRGETGVWEGP